MLDEKGYVDSQELRFFFLKYTLTLGLPVEIKQRFCFLNATIVCFMKEKVLPYRECPKE